jgi:hypothetical protein
MKGRLALMFAVPIVASCSGTDDADDADSRRRIRLLGDAIVASGLQSPAGGTIHTVLTPPHRTFESIACASTFTESNVFWSISGGDTSWVHEQDPVTFSSIRVFVVMVEPNAARERLAMGKPPPSAGDLFGMTPVLDCQPLSDGRWYLSDLEEDVVLDTVFEGCP